ncbi:3-oxoacyl-[acyl-carrier protein] reductase [Haloechinothrix alba]|uniref:3-oxoacyl-[acyl-carrier protein] reductase n=1 Tax=Haloechinothrix alba TaxID=664784 RepID=A0A238WU01_9PSEU|nr:SDR family oxidoreductase [Haloechinothrix alba]SNR50036.1 3-oxoacyl-[acyl-carrier protein] reductase [Haloechinothrix alba]
MTSRFSGEVAVVTGASRGIGLGIAEQLVADGARVCITARNQDALDEAVGHLGGKEHAIAVAGKSDNTAHQAEAIERTLAEFGRLDMLVNNAGINPVYGPLVDLDLDAARKIVEVNCLSALSWVQQAYRAWLGEHGGSIVNVSSVTGLKPAPGIGFYGASKAMLSHMTAELAVELGPDIRVNGVAPAVVKTAFASALYEGQEEEVSAAYPLKRLGVPGDVGSAVAFLLSAEASWMTGQTVVLDGGVTQTGGV